MCATAPIANECFRILLMTPYFLPHMGGLEFAVQNLALELQRLGHAAVVLTPRRSVREKARESIGGTIVYRIPMWLPLTLPRGSVKASVAFGLRCLLSPIVFPLSVLLALSIVIRHRVQIVNIHYPTSGTGFLAVVLKRLCGLRLIVNVHGTDVWRDPHRSRLCRKLLMVILQEADLLLANSQYLSRVVADLAPQLGRQAIAIGNGVDLSRFRSSCLQPVRVDDDYVLAVGRLVWQKGFDVAITAFSMVWPRYPKLRLLIVGEGDERMACERLADELGISRQVEFLGWRDADQVATLIKNARVLIVPSREESFGIVVCEAMAARTPVVASCVGGIPEIVTDGQTGLLVAPENPEELAQAMGYILDFPSEARRMADCGEEQIRRQFTWEEVATRYLSALREGLPS